MARVAVVLFDLDDTLFRHAEAVDAGVRAHLAALDLPLHADSLVTWHDLEEHHYHRYLSGELSFNEQRAARMTDFAAGFGIALEAPLDWYEAYLEHYRAAWTIHPDATECLDALEPARFGIITNGELSFQLPKLEAVGLAPRMEHVIASGSFGVAKPDPRIFVHACDVFGVTPAEAAYVGDRFTTDAMGAAAAGMVGVWVDRGAVATAAEQREAAASGVHIVRSLREVPAILA
jgi:putative hydrolase of the HAD superfamily